MKIYHTLLSLLGIIVVSSSLAQNIQSSHIEWTCSSTFTAQPGIITDEITRVVGNQESITWYDNNGAARKTLTISDTIGSWNNVSHNGSIIFNVTSGTDRGLVQFIRVEGAATIRIQIIGENEIQLYELTVTSLDAL